jgi:hypothetical protein
MSRFFLLALLAACNEYNTYYQGDKAGGDDTSPEPEDTGSQVVVETPCGELSATAHDVALNTECEIDLQTGTFTPEVEFHVGNSSFCGPPAVGQIVDSNGNGAIDFDDMPAIVYYSGGKVIALKGDNSGEYWRSQAGNVGQDGGFAIGDVDLDGWPEVIAVNSTTVTALSGRTGQTLWTSRPLSGLDSYGYNYPSIADMDGDGKPEVTVGYNILNGEDGSLQAAGNRGKGAAPYGGQGNSTYGTLSVPMDIDNDGIMELLTGNTFYNPDGSIKAQNNGPDGLVAVADFDGDGEGEIVITSGIYVSGIETNGSIAWGPKTYTGNLGAPAADDLDGDGLPEVMFAAQNTLVALQWGGRVVWETRISDSSGAAGPVLFDFELDGYPEVLYADETTIRFFSGIDGSVRLTSSEHGSYTILETPVVADVDNDGEVEIVLGHCSWTKSLTVYGDRDHSWPPGRKIWNQHGYSISNIADLGSVPSSTPNWPEYNSFRSGDIGRPPGEYLDLGGEIVDVCDDECGKDKVYIGAWVTNAGNIEAPAGIPVSILAGPGGAVLATQSTTQPIPSGKTGELLVFEVSAAALGVAKPVVVADSDAAGFGMVTECNEDNNVETWGERVCQE